MRSLAGGGPATQAGPAAARGRRGRVPVVPRVPFTPVALGVLLCRLVRFLPCVRYKILPAQCCADQSGTKLSLCGQNVPNRAISGVRGEFCTGYAVRAGVRGEFCTGGAWLA